MKKVKHLTSALVLILVLTLPSFGGIIDCPAPPPPPPAASLATEPGIRDTPGDIHLPGSPSDSATVAALNLLQRLLSVF
jgi:hypothetical protein